MSKARILRATHINMLNTLVTTAIALAAALFLLLPYKVQASDQTLAPNTEYQPQQVVKIVIDALQTNTIESDDDGIATVFRFASPRNRASTGPLGRFKNMIKRGFPDMLNHAGARYETMEVSGSMAVQAVWLYTDSGAEVGYAFQLGLQGSGEYEGMWMTDAVIPLGEGPGSGTSI